MAAAASQSWNWKSTSVGVLHVLILDSGKSQLDAACAGDCRRTAEMHSHVHLLDGLNTLGPDSFNRNNLSSNFGLKNGLIFHFDSVTCLPNFELFLSEGNHKPKLKLGFKLKIKPE